MTMTAEQTRVNAIPGTVRMWFNGIDGRDELKIQSGPWDNEPSKIQWVDKDTNLPCLLVRGGLGALCGYAGVFPGHPMHGIHYNETEHLEAHGGLTFSDVCAHSTDESRGVCHVPEPGTSDSVWWFGFDCAHCFDLTPLDSSRMLDLFSLKHGYVYRDVPYVAQQVATLAQQLSQLAIAGAA